MKKLMWIKNQSLEWLVFSYDHLLDLFILAELFDITDLFTTIVMFTSIFLFFIYELWLIKTWKGKKKREKLYIENYKSVIY